MGTSKRAKDTQLQQTTEQSAQPTADSATEQLNNSEQYTAEQVTQIVDEIVATPKRQRIWEVDFLRGFMILFVVWDHFMWDINSIGGGNYNTKLFCWLYDLSKLYYAGSLRKLTHPVFVTMFVFASGVSCSFSRNNGKRALKMIVFAMLFTAVTGAISSIMGVNLTINFNVIHVVALSVLLWAGIEWIWSKLNKAWQKNIFGVVMFAIVLTVLIVGGCANLSPWKNESPLWFWLADHNGSVPGFYKYMGGDYLPFFPDFGWFLVGALLGKWVYKNKTSLFPSVNPKYVAPVTFCGRYSIWIYFASQVVMFGFVYLFHDLLNWL